MSSEDAAKRALIEATLDMAPHTMSGGERCYSNETAIALDDWRDALTAYEQQIERRVLAQQPCRKRVWTPRGLETCNERESDELCPTCTARAAQTQETSALPPTDTTRGEAPST